MARRVSLPAADDLFGRRTTADREDPTNPEAIDDSSTPNGTAKPAVRAVPDRAESTRVRPSGRVKHDEKMTVYVTSAELIDLEQTRLALRAQQGLVVDRGRLVREAFAMVLEDFHERGEDSALVRRLLED